MSPVKLSVDIHGSQTGLSDVGSEGEGFLAASCHKQKQRKHMQAQIQSSSELLVSIYLHTSPGG